TGLLGGDAAMKIELMQKRLMKPKHLFFWLSLWFAFSPELAAAQSRSLRAMLVQPSATQALTDSYGRVIVGMFARILSEQGDRACLASRKLDAQALNRAAQNILVNYGNKLVEIAKDRVKDEDLERKLNELSGAGSADELRTLGDDRN